jgi:hypothetical protein
MIYYYQYWPPKETTHDLLLSVMTCKERGGGGRKRDHLNFPILLFHLCVTTFQHHLHMEYVYLSVGTILWCLSFPKYIEASEPRVASG